MEFVFLKSDKENKLPLQVTVSVTPLKNFRFESTGAVSGPLDDVIRFFSVPVQRDPLMEFLLFCSLTRKSPGVRIH